MEILAISLDTYGDQVLRQPLLSALLDAGHAVTVAIRSAYADIVPFLDPRLAAISCDVDTAPARTTALEAMLRTQPQMVVALAFNRTPFDNAILRACTDASRFALIDAGHGGDTHVAGNGHERPEEIDAIAAEIEHPIRVPATSREREKNDALYRAMAEAGPMLPRPRLRVLQDFSDIATRLLKARGLERSPFVVMGGAWMDPVKALPVEFAVESIVWLKETQGLPTLLTGVPSESGQLETIAALANERGAGPAIYIGEAGRIGELLALVAASRAYVGGDTGTMHFAAALGRPVAGLFGGGHFPRFEPDADHWFATTKRLLCFGCGWRCIYGKPRCIVEVDARTWFDGIDGLLRGESPGWVFAPGSVSEQTAESASEEFRGVIDILAEVEHDRAQRLGAVEVLTRKVGELQSALRISENDRARRLEGIETLTSQIGQLESAMRVKEADRAKRLEDIEALSSTVARLQDELRISEADRAARLEIIHRQAARITLLEQTAQERLLLLESSSAEQVRLLQELAIVNADREARLRVIEQQRESTLAYERAAASGAGTDKPPRT